MPNYSYACKAYFYIAIHKKITNSENKIMAYITIFIKDNTITVTGSNE